MSSQSSGSKRKRPVHSSLGNLFHPGKWRSKRARWKSPSPFDASALEIGNPHGPVWSNPNFKSPPSMRDSVSPLPSHCQSTTAFNALAKTPPPTHQSPMLGAGGSGSTGISTKGAWTGLENALRALRLTTRICPTLSSAVDDLVSCLPMFEGAAKNRRDYDELATGLKHMVDLLVRHTSNAASGATLDAVEGIAKAIRGEIKLIDTQQSLDLPRRMLGASSDEDDLLRRYRRIEQLFRQLQGEASMDTWNTVNALMIDKRLEGLHPAKLARFDSELATETSRRACTKDTRINILEDSMAWSDNPDLAKIYWMNGMAGTGKTTIAYSFCEQLEAGKQLAASFFCMRASPECRDAKRIVPTLAYQLARRLPPFRYSLCQQLKHDPDISTSQISNQFDLLLKKPLLEAKDILPNNLVVVVDALDECSDPHIVELLLSLLLRSAVELPVKFFIASRPEHAIWNKLVPQDEHLRSILYLHEIEKSLVQADIELYLREQLAFVSPANDDIKKLADRAGKLFIYAATAVRYIRPPGKPVNSQARLAAMLAVSVESNKKLSAIDALYSAILVAALEDDDLEPEERGNIRLVLWTVICACEPILIKTLSVLCTLYNEDATMIALQSLRSVLHISSRSEAVATLHASFPDYMLNKERSGAFFCDKPAHSQLLAEQCFKIMQAQLRFNICSIQSSFVPDDEIPKLAEQIDANISEDLFYACRFWIDHLTQINLKDLISNYPTLVHSFLSQQLLFWMEVLNLKKCIVVCPAIMNKLNIWLTQEGEDVPPDLLRLTSDAFKFVANYAASRTIPYTPHIYLSALPFSPRSSSVRSCYWPRFQGLVTVSGTATKKLEHPTLGVWRLLLPTRSIAFSSDGDRIVIGDETGDLCVQTTYDGSYAFQPFKAHGMSVGSVGFSRDGTEIVSGSDDMTLSVWSALNGSLISGPFKGHEEGVTSVEFSPDGAHIASGSYDCTVGISATYRPATPMRRLLGHTEPIQSLSFSPDGRCIISGSSDNTSRIWDLASGTTLRILQLGGPDSCYYIVSARFLLNGSYFLAGSDGHTIRTWDASDTSFFSDSAKHSGDLVTSIAISPEGDCVASGSESGEIHVWSMDGDKLVDTPFICHTKEIRAIRFSDDGSRIISVSRDNTMRIWNIRSRKDLTRLPRRPLRRPAPVVALSPDTVHATIYDSTERELHIWDMQQARLVTSVPWTKEDVDSLQYSLDATHVFSVHNCGKIYKWDAHTAQLLDGPHRFSTRGDNSSTTCSFDGTRVVAVQGSYAELWDVQSNRLIAVFRPTQADDHEYQDLDSSGCKVIFSGKSRRFLTSTAYFTRHTTARDVWDNDSGTHIAGPFETAHFSHALDISPDGTFIACRVDRDVVGVPIGLLDVNSGDVLSMPHNHEILPPNSNNPAISANFTPDGDHLACSVESACYIWNIRDQTVITLLTTLSRIRTIKYSLDDWCFATSEHSKGLLVSRFHLDALTKPFMVRNDGWVLDDQSQVLLWVPADIRAGFPGSSGIFIADDGTTCGVDYSGMVAGDRWSECYIGN